MFDILLCFRLNCFSVKEYLLFCSFGFVVLDLLFFLYMNKFISYIFDFVLFCSVFIVIWFVEMFCWGKVIFLWY